MSGFIKDYRSELKSDIWLMSPLYHRVWQYLKYKVNHAPNKIPMEDGTFFNISPGQHLTSLRNIAEGVGYYEGKIWREPNPRTISKILEWLVKQDMISIDRGRGNRQYTLITLSNWDFYQSKNDRGNSKTTASTSGSKQPVHINKNDKNDKEVVVSEEPFVFYQNNFGVLNSFIGENIGHWIDDLSKELVVESMKIALKAGKRFDYAEGVLKKWRSEGITSLDDVKAAKASFERKREKKNAKDIDWEGLDTDE